MTVSKATADLCLSLIAQVPLTVTDPDFDAKVAQLTKARDELLSVPTDKPVSP
jgi:hypothetical protein